MATASYMHKYKSTIIHKYTDTNTQIKLHKSKHTNAPTDVGKILQNHPLVMAKAAHPRKYKNTQIHRYNYTKVNTQMHPLLRVKFGRIILW